MTQAIRPQRSGNQNRQRAKAREKELAEAGKIELKLLVRAEDFEPLVVARQSVCTGLWPWH